VSRSPDLRARPGRTSSDSGVTPKRHEVRGHDKGGDHIPPDTQTSVEAQADSSLRAKRGVYPFVSLRAGSERHQDRFALLKVGSSLALRMTQSRRALSDKRKARRSNRLPAPSLPLCHSDLS